MMKIRRSAVVLFLTAVAVLAVVGLLRESPHLFSPLTYLSEPLKDIALLDHRGDYHRLSYYSDQKAIVLISYGIGCPIARHALSNIRTLHEKFSGDNTFIALFDPIPEDTREELIQEAEEFLIPVPILMDEAQLLAKSLDVERTAEAFVIDPRTMRIVYRGAISDRLGYEFQKDKTTHHYLEEAVSALIRRRTPAVRQTEVKGCLIHYPDEMDISYENDIVPILETKCMGCHYSGGLAPWAMTDYQTLVKWGPMIGEVVRQKRMPPRLIDGYYGHVRNETSLAPGQLRSLTAWLGNGMPKADGAADPLPGIDRRLSETEWPFGPPDLIIEAKQPLTIRPTGNYQFPILNRSEAEIPEDMWVKAVYYRPSNAKVVHHASVWITRKHPVQRPAAQIEFVRPLELLTLYGPGLEQYPYPPGTGKFLPGGTKITFLMHYITTGKEETEQPKVGIYLYKNGEKPKPYIHYIIEDNDIVVPRKTKHYERSVSHIVEKDIVLFGLGPHMHYRGKASRILVNYADGREEILLSVPKFDYDWNAFYEMDKPVYIPAGSTLTMTSVFDNSEQNLKNPDPDRDVKYGGGRPQEMFWAVLSFVEVTGEDDAGALMAAYRDSRLTNEAGQPLAKKNSP